PRAARIVRPLSSTLSLFSGSAEVSLLGAMEGRPPSHRTQGGSHGQYNQPAPQAVVPERTPSGGRGLSPPRPSIAAPEPTSEEAASRRPPPPVGPKGGPERAPTQAALPPAPQAGPHRLPAAGKGPDPAHLSPPRRAGPGRHPYRGWPHHRQLA